jgi:hypothetical protein
VVSSHTRCASNGALITNICLTLDIVETIFARHHLEAMLPIEIMTLIAKGAIA